MTGIIIIFNCIYINLKIDIFLSMPTFDIVIDLQLKTITPEQIVRVKASPKK